MNRSVQDLQYSFSLGSCYLFFDIQNILWELEFLFQGESSGILLQRLLPCLFFLLTSVKSSMCIHR